MYPNIKGLFKSIRDISLTPLFLFKKPKKISCTRSLILFPIENTRLNCGLSGILTFSNNTKTDIDPGTIITKIDSLFETMSKIDFKGIETKNFKPETYLDGEKKCIYILELTNELKKNTSFSALYEDQNLIDHAKKISTKINLFCNKESDYIEKRLGILPPQKASNIVSRLEILKDASWALDKEILDNIEKIKLLSGGKADKKGSHFYRKINTVLNSINILEVRGRDSAGISVFITFADNNFQKFQSLLKDNSFEDIYNYRKNLNDLINYKISLNRNLSGEQTIVFTYKFASEIGSLGDNIAFIRNQIKNDFILNAASKIENINITVGAHTRWASVGEISQLNCHPLDNKTIDITKNSSHLIHVSLNGDIDNYQELKTDFQNRVDKIPHEITTDTKIIPLQISKYYYEGNSIEESFRLAVKDFKGSHAILMQTDLSPGKIYLAQKGSGQAIFIGISQDSYTIASEVYGFVERTQNYYKLQGEKLNGQIVILDENKNDKLKGIKSLTYDGEDVIIDNDSIQYTPITSRDVDRQNFEHFFLKEIFESPRSVRRTLQGRWEIKDLEKNLKKVSFDESIFPAKIKQEFINNNIKRIFFIGQGTAGVAANTSSFLVSHYLNNNSINTMALKSSELSGFIIDEKSKDSMKDSLVVAITQSGTTTDTNKSIDMAKACGAKTMAIVNRRDSDITSKVDGVLYTSTGRDIEMSVASTKAFYSQVTAGALLGLFLADLLKTGDENYISNEIENLSNIPSLMEQVLDKKEEIKKAAADTAPKKTYWATVGSGPNKAAADEIRIKLSELCYRTISSDYVEDKKHIDLSSEPLILVCAAGTREAVLSDIIKDNAIFKAHKSTTIVFADEDDTRFDNDSNALIKIPKTGEHLSPILITLAGHLWGYYAAKAINRDSKFFFIHRKNIKNTIDTLTSKNKELFEVLLEKEFKETMASFYRDLRIFQKNKNFLSILPSNFTSDLILILNYLLGRLNASEFEIDFSIKGTPSNMINMLFEKLSLATDLLSRPIDAIKHQAKTVTVGTSRIGEKLEGILFDEVVSKNISIDQITPLNLVVIKNMQGIIEKIKGSVLYKIDNLNLLGEPTDNTTISIISKSGNLSKVISRVEGDTTLKGTKRIIVKEGNVFIGKGQKDGRPLLIIPLTPKEGAKKHQRIEYLLSLAIDFKKDIPLYVKAKALGGKLDRIKNNVMENNIRWNNSLLDLLKAEELFGLSYEKIVETIVLKSKNE